MLKNRKLLIRGGASVGLIVLTCFCCLIFRTRFPDFASVAPSPTPAPIALPAVFDIAYDCAADFLPTPAIFDSPCLTIRTLDALPFSARAELTATPSNRIPSQRCL